MMHTVLPREEAVEAIFSKIVASPASCEQLREVVYEHLEDEQIFEKNQAEHFTEVLFQAYKNGDISALLLELCGRSMFDLLREAYLIPKKFHGKAGENPVLLTDVDGNLLPGKEQAVSGREYEKFRNTYQLHECAPRSKVYLADGYDLIRSYTEGMQIEETKENRQRGVLALYALPDTFHEIQMEAPRAIVYYGQETGVRQKKEFDEIGILLPIHEFEKKMLHHLHEIDGIVLTCREKLLKRTGSAGLDLE